MTRKSFVLMVAGTMIFFLCSVSSAVVPDKINYQGKLTTGGGGCLNDTVEMTFSIYPDTLGSPADWTEDQDSVVVKDGIFNVLLGSVNPIPDTVFDGSTKYLGVQVESDPEMRPLKPMVSVAYAYRARTADGGGVPVGTIVAYGSPIPPDGWLICDSSEISRTEYAKLFTAIGTIWGDGDGLTTFNLPDLRGRGPIGAGQGSGLTNRTVSETGGEEQHTLTINEMPSHTHSSTTYDGGPSGGDPNVFDGTDSSWPFGTATIGSTGGGQAHNNMQPYAVVNFIIKY